MARVIINQISFSNKINGALTKKRFHGIVGNAAQSRLDFAKENVIKEFNESLVTKEIEAGPTADSFFLDKGNIVSFVGIENGPQMIAEIRNKLQIGIKMNKTPEFSRTKNGVVYSFTVKAPSLQEIYESAPSEWSSKSIPELIQNGISNILYFLYSKSGRFAQWSRSGTGLQSQHKRKNGRSSKVLGIPWLNSILSNFRARFTK